MRYSYRQEEPFTMCPNAVLDTLARVNLTPYEARCLHFLIRKTFGFHKDADRIALSQFERGTGLDRRNAHRALKTLHKKHIVKSKRDPKGCSYKIETNTAKWLLSSAQTIGTGLVIGAEDISLSEQTTNLSSTETNTKENEKENIERKVVPSAPLSDFFSKEIRTSKPMSEADRAARRELLRVQAAQLLNNEVAGERP